ARDLTEATEGNAVGIGLADFITKRLYDKIDYQKTNINCLCGISPEKARVPIVGESDQNAIDMALGTIGNVPPEKAKVIWIKSTLILGEVEVSEAFKDEVQKRPDLEALTGPRELKFDAQGNLLPL
ncbi:MAG: [Fe-S]-binding protein, partial [bacterium]